MTVLNVRRFSQAKWVTFELAPMTSLAVASAAFDYRHLPPRSTLDGSSP